MARSAGRMMKVYCRERDAVLRALDEEKFDAHYRKWALERPREWLPGARMILMHKARLQLRGFNEEERAASRQWLLEHGCSLPGSDG